MIAESALMISLIAAGMIALTATMTTLATMISTAALVAISTTVATITKAITKLEKNDDNSREHKTDDSTVKARETKTK